MLDRIFQFQHLLNTSNIPRFRKTQEGKNMDHLEQDLSTDGN